MEKKTWDLFIMWFEENLQYFLLSDKPVDLACHSIDLVLLVIQWKKMDAEIKTMMIHSKSGHYRISRNQFPFM